MCKYTGKLIQVLYTNKFSEMQNFYSEKLGLPKSFAWDRGEEDKGVYLSVGRYGMIEVFQNGGEKPEGCIFLKIGSSRQSGNELLLDQEENIVSLYEIEKVSEDHFETEYSLHSVLHVEDLEKSNSFYSEILGLESISCESGEDFHKHINFEICRGANTGIEIYSDTFKAIQSPQLILIEAHDVDDCYEKIACKFGAHLIEPLTDLPHGVRRFMIEDPDGNRIGLYAPSTEQ
jgi:predicted enzyme related to lactoylglutathione lyase